MTASLATRASFILSDLVPLGQVVQTLRLVSTQRNLKARGDALQAMWDPLHLAFMFAKQCPSEEKLHQLSAWATGHLAVVLAQLGPPSAHAPAVKKYLESALSGHSAPSPAIDLALHALSRAAGYQRSLTDLFNVAGYSPGHRHEWIQSAAGQEPPEFSTYSLRSLARNAGTQRIRGLFGLTRTAQDCSGPQATTKGVARFKEFLALAETLCLPTPHLVLESTTESASPTELRVSPAISVTVDPAGFVVLEAATQPLAYLSETQLAGLPGLESDATLGRLLVARRKRVVCAPSVFYEGLQALTDWLSLQRVESAGELQEAYEAAKLRRLRKRLKTKVVDGLSLAEVHVLRALLDEKTSGV